MLLIPKQPLFDLNLLIHNDTVSTKIHDKRDDFDIVNFPFFDGNVPQRPSYAVYIYLNLFALPEHLCMVMTSIIVTKLLKQCYRYHKLRKVFSKFYRTAL